MGGLELLLKELNPNYDMARQTYDNSNSFLKMFQDVGICCLNQWKSIIRGGIIGGVVGVGLGSLYSLVGGEDFLNGVEYGGRIGLVYGAVGDMVQYTYRFMWYSHKQMNKISLFPK